MVKPVYGEVYRDPADGETVMIISPSSLHGIPNPYWSVLSMCWENGDMEEDQPVTQTRRLEGWDRLE